MSQIVNPTIFSPPPAPSAPLDSSQAAISAAIAQMTANLSRDMALFYRLANLIWNNPQGKTPQQMFTYLGNSAASLVTLCNAWIGFVEAYTGQQIPVVPSGWTLTSNTDGTVTVTQA